MGFRENVTWALVVYMAICFLGLVATGDMIYLSGFITGVVALVAWILVVQGLRRVHLI